MTLGRQSPLFRKRMGMMRANQIWSSNFSSRMAQASERECRGVFRLAGFSCEPCLGYLLSFVVYFHFNRKGWFFSYFDFCWCMGICSATFRLVQAPFWQAWESMWKCYFLLIWLFHLKQSSGCFRLVFTGFFSKRKARKNLTKIPVNKYENRFFFSLGHTFLREGRLRESKAFFFFFYNFGSIKKH